MQVEEVGLQVFFPDPRQGAAGQRPDPASWVSLAWSGPPSSSCVRWWLAAQRAPGPQPGASSARSEAPVTGSRVLALRRPGAQVPVEVRKHALAKRSGRLPRGCGCRRRGFPGYGWARPRPNSLPARMTLPSRKCTSKNLELANSLSSWSFNRATRCLVRASYTSGVWDQA